MARSHLTLGARRGLAARLAAAIEVERSAPSGLDDLEAISNARTALVAFVHAQSDRLLLAQSGAVAPLSQKAIAEIRDWSTHVTDAVPKEVISDCERVTARLNQASCAGCVSLARAKCSNDQLIDSFDDIAARQGPCIHELFDLFDQVNIWVRQRYAQYIGKTTLPGASLTVGEIPRSTQIGLAPKLGVLGWTDVTAKANSAVVGLQIERCRLNWRVICALPYIFAHELICHAYQNIGHSGRKNSFENCHWSEGWMDVLATKLLVGWLGGGKGSVPSWILGSESRIRRVWDELHNNRFEDSTVSGLSATRLQMRELMRDAFEEMLGHYSGQRSANQVGLRRLTEFSLTFNSMTFTVDNRNLASTALAVAFRQDSNDQNAATRDMLIAACNSFVRTRDAATLLAAFADATDHTRAFAEFVSAN